MTAYSSLRTRLQARLGLSVSSAVEEALQDEALNAAMCVVAAEGAPQLRQVYSGYTLAASNPTITHSANASTATLSSVTGVYPGDILVNATTGRSYLIRTVTTSGATIDLGVPIVSSMTGNTVSVTRRSLLLPHAGTVWALWEASGRELKNEPLIAAAAQFETGVPTRFTQGYAETLGVSYISLFPAPTSSTQYIIVQGPAFTEDSDIYASEAVLQAILSRAYEFRMMMSSQGGMAQMAAAMSVALQALRTRAGQPTGIQVR